MGAYFLTAGFLAAALGFFAGVFLVAGCMREARLCQNHEPSAKSLNLRLQWTVTNRCQHALASASSCLLTFLVVVVFLALGAAAFFALLGFLAAFGFLAGVFFAAAVLGLAAFVVEDLAACEPRDDTQYIRATTN